MEKERFLSAVYMIIKNQNGEILLQRRQGSSRWPGFLGLPAGHIDEGENVYDAIIREASEELNICITKEDLGDYFVANRRNKSAMPYFDIYFEVTSFKGDITINEPDKCSELKWCDINNLPYDLIDFQAEAIKNWQNGIKFSVIDTDNEITFESLKHA